MTCRFIITPVVFQNHCVVVFDQRGNCQRRSGSETTTPFPSGVDNYTDGTLLIGSTLEDKMEIALFQKDKILMKARIDGLQSSQRCTVKVSSGGKIWTVAALI